MNIPFVVDKVGDSERTYDIYSKLLEDRIIFLSHAIDTSTADSVVAQLLYLDQKDPKKDIYLYINSPGGYIKDGLAIYDTINFIRPDVVTVCVGEAASMAAFLLSSGAKGKRAALPNSRIMIHQPRQTFNNTTLTVTEQEIDLQLVRNQKQQLNEILAANTGKTIEEITKDCEFDKWFRADEAKEYGLVDEIIVKKT